LLLFGPWLDGFAVKRILGISRGNSSALTIV